MNTPMHVLITETALDCLTGECRAFWRSLKTPMSRASNYPDYFAAGDRDDERNVLIDPDWREYNTIPTGTTVEHIKFDPLKLRETYPAMLKHWTKKIITNIKSGDYEKAAKFAGVLSHIVGDTGQAAHVFDERYLKYLLPQGDKCFVIHPTIERISGRIGQFMYQPEILAVSLDELNWRMIEELEILKCRNMAEVVPIMQAVLHDDHAAAEASASRTLVSCIELFADVLFTIWNLIFNKSLQIENEFELKRLLPFKEHCDMLFNYGIMVDRIPGKDINEPLVLDLGHGETPGIALLADMAPFHETIRESFVDYSIPGGVFKYFVAEIGLNHNSLNETKAVFKVLLDGRIVYESKAMSGDDDGVEIKIELKEAERLRLYVCDARPAPCDTKFFYPVFANPRFFRSL